MAIRRSRNTALPEVQRSRVDDQRVQLAFDSITTPLAAVQRLLQPLQQPEVWKVLPYSGDWRRDLATLQEPQYRANILDEVVLRGWVASSTGTNNLIAVLPRNYRPETRCSFALFRIVGGAHTLVRVDVDVDGRVIISAPAMPAAPIEVSLDGIRFSRKLNAQ